MFEFIRKHLKVVMIAFFPLVLFAFVFVGMDTTFLTARSPVVARVAGADITQNDWDFAHRQYADRARADNRELTSAMLDSPAQRYGVLEGLVRDQLFAATARDRNYVVSDVQLARALQTQPEIAALFGPDGRLDVEAYRSLLAQNGLTTDQYENNVRYQLTLQQVLGVVQQTSLTTPTQASASVDALFQRRNAGIKRFVAQDYAAQVNVTDEDVQGYYDAHQALFQRPETVDVQYVVLDLEQVMTGIDVNEDELQSYYQNNQTAYAQSSEQRRARHILFSTDASMSSSAREAARSRAEAALAQVRADPSQFETVAREQSDDTGSAAAGGDLGFFDRGAMVADFDAAVFSMQPEDISDIVATEYGFHIIQLLEIQPAQIPSFEDVRERLQRDVRNDLARTQFIEKADLLRNLAHERPDSLQPIADELGLTIQTAAGITRTPDGNTPAPLQSPVVLAALFEPRATQDGENIDAVDTGGNQMVTARVTQLHPAQVLPLEAVRNDVERLFIEQESAVLARQAGEQSLQAWQANAAEVATDEDIVVSRQMTHGLSAQGVNQILTLPEAELPKVLGFAQEDGSYTLVQVRDIAPLQDDSLPEDIQQALAGAYESQIQQMLAAAETEAYYETLKQSYKVQIRAPRPR